nr:dienelactone hydrolase family protein [Pseudomonas sp. D8002]
MNDSACVMVQRLDYRGNDGVPLVAYLALPAGTKPTPAVLVAHEWWGNNDYPRNRARQLAKQGYAALALDMYGNG